MILLWLSACARDPNLLGYWDVTRWSVEGAEVQDAGSIEFTAANLAVLVFSYRYEGGELVPDPTPNIETLDAPLTHTNEDHDQLLPTYQSDGERYFVDLEGRYEVLDWTGGAMRLHARAAAPYGTWQDFTYDAYGNTVPSVQVEAEMELVR